MAKMQVTYSFKSFTKGKEYYQEGMDNVGFDIKHHCESIL